MNHDARRSVQEHPNIVPPRFLGTDYALGGLAEPDLDASPFVQFEKWFADARASGLKEPHAMTLATATADGRPSARVVLLKGLGQDGFVFYTNYDSRKGRELSENPAAALVFFWPELERQVRIAGRVEKVIREESDAYFHSRPLTSQLGAWASRQSETIPDRDLLAMRVAELKAEYADRTIPLPPFWGGYRVVPDSIEFWQGRPSRLHDRLLYTRQTDGNWLISRLSP